MARYSLRSRPTIVTAAAATWELRSSSSDRLYLMELGLFSGTATAWTVGLGRPQAIGVTPTSPVALQAEDAADAAATGQVAIAWGTAPTVPLQFFRVVALPANIGAGIIWTFGPKGIVVPVSSSIVLWNLATAPVTMDVYCVVEE
jgi:hypothetical protein